MHIQAPQVESIRDLHHLSEVFSIEDGLPKFSRSAFAIVANDYHAYFGQSPIRKKELTSKDVAESLKLIPDENVYPKAPPHITKVSKPIDAAVFVKGPKIGSYDIFEGTGLLPKLLLQEAEIFEHLMRHQHPNIIRYHGCVIKRGRIVGLVLDRYPLTLRKRMESSVHDFSKDLCFDKVKLATEHLHSLGLAHNYLTPDNIVVDGQDNPFLIDYGSCQPFGKDLITAGTPGWIDEDFTTSAQRNDEIALGKLQAWMKKQKS